MDETDVLTLPDDFFTGNSFVGPNYDGTYGVPNEAQPTNQAWDTGGQGIGNYSGVLGILQGGIAAYIATQKRIVAQDYRSYQATAGGLFQVGQPTAMTASRAAAQPRLTGTGMMLLAGLAWFLLK